MSEANAAPPGRHRERALIIALVLSMLVNVTFVVDRFRSNDEGRAASAPQAAFEPSESSRDLAISADTPGHDAPPGSDRGVGPPMEPIARGDEQPLDAGRHASPLELSADGPPLVANRAVEGAFDSARARCGVTDDARILLTGRLTTDGRLTDVE